MYTSITHRLFFVSVVILFSVIPVSADVLFADSLLTTGATSRPHQIFTDSELILYELPTYDAKTYWVVNSTNLDEEILDDYSFWGLLYNDFYRYYHNADINVSTDLKKKVFEKSDLYTELKDEMKSTRDILLSDTIHMPLHNFVNYAREYDIKRGGFFIREELDKELPPFISDKTSNVKYHGKTLSINIIHEPRAKESRYPKYFAIPNSLSGKIESTNDRHFSFFMPIANEEIAVQIEDMNRPYDNSFDLLIQFHYVQKPEPYVELVDIILLRNKDKHIIWTLSNGDLSNNE